MTDGARTIAVTAEINVPQTPNFLRMTDGQTLPISAVDEPSLLRIGEAWTANLVEKARQKRAKDSGGESQGGGTDG